MLVYERPVAEIVELLPMENSMLSFDESLGDWECVEEEEEY